MFTIEGLRLNRFEYIKMPTRRQLYDQMNRAGLLRNHTYKVSEDSPYGEVPDNFAEGLSKVDQMDLANGLMNQAIDAEKLKSNSK